MSIERVFFAGGGTGGHIYPAIAVAEKIAQLDGSVKIHFFCSDRPVDTQILSKTNFSYTPLGAQ
ncbi:MAG: glycosyltransferase, partial [Phycisphaerae bacterium]